MGSFHERVGEVRRQSQQQARINQKASEKKQREIQEHVIRSRELLPEVDEAVSLLIANRDWSLRRLSSAEYESSQGIDVYRVHKSQRRKPKGLAPPAGWRIEIPRPGLLLKKRKFIIPFSGNGTVRVGPLDIEHYAELGIINTPGDAKSDGQPPPEYTNEMIEGFLGNLASHLAHAPTRRT